MRPKPQRINSAIEPLNGLAVNPVFGTRPQDIVDYLWRSYDIKWLTPYFTALSMAWMEGLTTVPLRRFALLSLLALVTVEAQVVRDAWKYERDDDNVILREDDDPRVETLSEAEQKRIREAVEQNRPNYTIPDERKVVARMFAKEVQLGRGSRKELLVWANAGGFCGGTGNCSLWLFSRAHGQLKPILSGLASWIVIEKALLTECTIWRCGRT